MNVVRYGPVTDEYRSRFFALARALALAAVAGFWLQGLALQIVAAHAAAGAMLEPAVAISETAHSHGHFAAHSHAHGHSADGHVHDPVSPVDDGNHGAIDGPSWTVFPPATTVLPDAVELSPPDATTVRVPAASETGKGTAPPSAVKPPSTPGIA
jgi:hypothetical protein